MSGESSPQARVADMTPITTAVDGNEASLMIATRPPAVKG